MTPKDVRKLADWLDEYKAELRDRQMKADANSGKLDKLVADAKREIAESKVRPL